MEDLQERLVNHSIRGLSYFEMFEMVQKNDHSKFVDHIFEIEKEHLDRYSIETLQRCLELSFQHQDCIITKRLLQIESMPVDEYDDGYIFYLAKNSNNPNLMKILLEDDRIDINKKEIKATLT